MPLSLIKTNSIAAGNITTALIASGNITSALISSLSGLSVANTAITGRISTAQQPIGAVLQVVQTTLDTTYSTATMGSWVSAGLTGTITPTSSTSKILATISGGGYCDRASTQMVLTIYRGATNLYATGYTLCYNSGGAQESAMTFSVLDSPATTSATTYTAYQLMTNSAGTIAFNIPSASGIPRATMTLMEIAA